MTHLLGLGAVDCLHQGKCVIPGVSQGIVICWEAFAQRPQLLQAPLPAKLAAPVLASLGLRLGTCRHMGRAEVHEVSN